MPYARVDDNFPEHPNIAALSDRAFRAHVRGICYANRLLSDGFIPDYVARGSGAKALHELLAGDKPRWAKVDGGYEVVGYLDWNPSATVVKAARAQRRAAAEKRWSKDAGRNADDDAPRNAGDDAGRNASRTGSRMDDAGRMPSRNAGTHAIASPAFESGTDLMAALDHTPAEKPPSSTEFPEHNPTLDGLDPNLQALATSIARQTPSYMLSGNVIRSEISKHGGTAVVEALQSLASQELGSIPHPNAHFRSVVADRVKASNGQEPAP
jgi:hypothetical protein